MELALKSLVEEKEALNQKVIEKTQVIYILNKDNKDIRKENETTTEDLITMKEELDKLKGSELPQITAILKCDVRVGN